MEPLITIQVLRAAAALFVLVAHGLAALPLPGFPAGGAGVDLFFVISGFVMVYASEPIFAKPGATLYFWSRRIVRIVPLYWIATTLLLVYFLYRYGGLQPPDKPWAGVAASYAFYPYPSENRFFPPLLAVGWTLQFEMFFYLLFGAAVCLTRRAAVLTLSAALVLLCVLGATIGLPMPLQYFSGVGFVVLEFAMGMMIALAFLHGVRMPRIAALVMVAGGFAVMIATGGEIEPRALYWGVPAAAVVAGSVLVTAPRPTIGWSVAAFLGDCSYALYLFHPMAIGIPRQAGIDFAQSYPVAYLALMLASAIACAVVVHLFIERPITGFLRQAADLARTKKARPEPR